MAELNSELNNKPMSELIAELEYLVYQNLNFSNIKNKKAANVLFLIAKTILFSKIISDKINFAILSNLDELNKLYKHINKNILIVVSNLTDDQIIDLFNQVE